MRKLDRVLTVVALALSVTALLTLAACEQPTPEERVAAMRAEYEAQLNSFNVREVPVVVEADTMEEAGEEGEAADATEEQPAEGEEGEEGAEELMEPVPVRQDVMLDIVLRKLSGTERMEGITLDVYQMAAGDEENEKASYRIWVDVSRLNPGSRQAVTHVLEDVDYEEGDGFAVEVRQPVPPEIRGEYKEFQDVTEDGAGA